MSKNSSAKYYRDNKERLQKEVKKDIKIFLKKKKKRNKNMVVNDIKIYQKMKNKVYLPKYRKNIKWRKKNILL